MPQTINSRSRNDSSTASSIDPFHYQALQDTNEALKSEVQRLARADEENTNKLKQQVLSLKKSRRSIEFCFLRSTISISLSTSVFILSKPI